MRESREANKLIERQLAPMTIARRCLCFPHMGQMNMKSSKYNSSASTHHLLGMGQASVAAGG